MVAVMVVGCGGSGWCWCVVCVGGVLVAVVFDGGVYVLC